MLNRRLSKASQRREEWGTKEDSERRGREENKTSLFLGINHFHATGCCFFLLRVPTRLPMRAMQSERPRSPHYLMRTPPKLILVIGKESIPQRMRRLQQEEVICIRYVICKMAHRTCCCYSSAPQLPVADRQVSVTYSRAHSWWLSSPFKKTIFCPLATYTRYVFQIYGR